jgi:hypothetical protein
MVDEPDADTEARHFEAYLLWLFGYVLFCSSQGDAVPKQLIPYARAIADAPLRRSRRSALALLSSPRRTGAFVQVCTRLSQ